MFPHADSHVTGERAPPSSELGIKKYLHSGSGQGVRQRLGWYSPEVSWCCYRGRKEAGGGGGVQCRGGPVAG